MKRLLEIWLPVKGFEGKYEVSSYGRVRSVDHYSNLRSGGKRFVKGRVLKPQVACGYQQVYFYIGNKKQKWYKVHQLVADAFLPVPPYLLMQLEAGEFGRLEINHKNENKLDCRVENLEWCSSIYNNNWGTAKERVMKTHIERGHWFDYSGLTEEEKKEKRKERERKYNHTVYVYVGDELYGTYKNGVAAARVLGLSRTQMYQYTNGLVKKPYKGKYTIKTAYKNQAS